MTQDEIENTEQAVFVGQIHEKSRTIALKVRELLSCTDGSLSATGKCNDLVCDLLKMSADLEHFELK